MTSTHPLAGVYAAAVTPLKDDSTLDLESVPVLLNFLASRGCHGAVLFGTTGEGPSFSPREREALLRAACKYRNQQPGFRLIAGTGTPSLSESIDLTKLAFDLGYADRVDQEGYEMNRAVPPKVKPGRIPRPGQGVGDPPGKIPPGSDRSAQGLRGRERETWPSSRSAY